MRLAALVVLATAAASASASPPDPDIQPGYWEFSERAVTTTGNQDMDDMLGLQPQSGSNRQCLDAATIASMFRDGPVTEQTGCRMQVHNHTRSALYVSMACELEGEDGTLENSSHEVRYEFAGSRLVVEMRSEGSALVPVVMTYRSEGRYLGACPAG